MNLRHALPLALALAASAPGLAAAADVPAGAVWTEEMGRHGWFDEIMRPRDARDCRAGSGEGWWMGGVCNSTEVVAV